MRYYTDEEDEIKMDFASQLIRDCNATGYFSGLSAQRQNEIVNASRYIGSRPEMRRYISNLSDFTFK